MERSRESGMLLTSGRPAHATVRLSRFRVPLGFIVLSAGLRRACGRACARAGVAQNPARSRSARQSRGHGRRLAPA